ncbi:hypothetical protein C8R42DRAFT_729829 [Lentinula raphanica]|nr:hypothetical protein C8R42DRAFT_729829 [Lentinula raphanica]
MNRLALQVVCVVSAVSTALAAPTLLPPSEALSGLEEPSNAPLHQFQADGFSATAGLNVREPRATTILVDSVVGSDDLSDKTRPLSFGEESSNGLLRHFQADEFSATGLDVREPQATSLIVDPVAGSSDLFDKTGKLRDDADDRDQSAVTDPSYARVDLKLGRRADASQQEPEDRHPTERQGLLNVHYSHFVRYWQEAQNALTALTSQSRSEWGSLHNRGWGENYDHFGHLAISYLRAAHRYGTYRTYVDDHGHAAAQYLPDYGPYEAEVTAYVQQFQAAAREWDLRLQEALAAQQHDLQNGGSKRSRRH